MVEQGEFISNRPSKRFIISQYSKTVKLLPVFVTIAIWQPMLSSAQFFVDWVNSYWLVLASVTPEFPQWGFGKTIGLVGLEPWQLFYGGYLFQFLGKLSELTTVFGIDALAIYRLSYVVLAILGLISIMAIGRALRIKQLYYTSLALIYMGTPYLLTNAFGRGAYSEYVATALIVPLCAFVYMYISGYRSHRFVELVVFTLGLTLFLTTHLLSLVLTTLSICIVVLSCMDVRSFKKILKYLSKSRKRFYTLVCCASAAVFFSSPQLLPAILSQSGVPLSKPTSVVDTFSKMATLFRPYPYTPVESTTPGLKTQIPTLLLVWVIIVSIFLWKRIGGKDQSILVRFSIALVIHILLITNGTLWTYLPRYFQVIQFSYRFITYATIVILMASIFVCKSISKIDLAQFEKVLLGFSLVAVCIVSLCFAFQQTRNAVIRQNTIDLSSISAESTPATWYAVPMRQIGEIDKFVTANFIVDFQSSTKIFGHLRCSDYLYSTPIELPIAASKWMQIRGITLIGSSPSGLVVGYFNKCDSAKNVHVEANLGSTTQKYQALTAVCLICGLILLLLSKRLNSSGNPRRTRLNLQEVSK